MAKTKIEWTANINPDGTVSQGFTFNPWRGCSKVSPACKNCYAMELVNRFGGDFLGKRVVASESYWKEPLKWNSRAKHNGVKQRVFCASLADVFEDWSGVLHTSDGQELYRPWHHAQPEFVASAEPCEGERLTLDDVRARLFRLIDATPNLDWLLLTKRPENILKMWRYRVSDYGQDSDPVVKQLLLDQDRTKALNYRPNVWLGTTVENQEQADKRISELLKCRDLSPVLFLSCEPLLGPIDLQGLRITEFDKTGLPWFDALDGTAFSCDDVGHGYPSINWVIVGGESGDNFRPMQTEWVQSLHDQCKAAGVPFFCKQGAGPKPGQQYDLPDYLFEVKEFPS